MPSKRKPKGKESKKAAREWLKSATKKETRRKNTEDCLRVLAFGGRGW